MTHRMTSSPHHPISVSPHLGFYWAGPTFLGMTPDLNFSSLTPESPMTPESPRARSIDATGPVV
jgi:hypothetical protein